MHIAALSILLLTLQTARPSDCRWGAASQTGTLAPAINEASGLAISRRFPGRMYHVNDSGEARRFFMTDLSGRNTRQVSLTGRGLDDTEDLAIAPCDAAADCLFIADIGDNDRKRKDVEIVVVEERADFPERLRARSRVRARYPDGPHDAESLSVHPDGNIYILTKSLEVRGFVPTVDVARVYRLKRNDWRRDGDSEAMLQLVTTIDFAKLLPASKLGGRIPTSMDIASDGKRVLILTYQDAVELFVDLSAPTITAPDTWKEGQHFRRIPLIPLEQQEAISYMPNGRAFIYTTEGRNARIMTVRCQN